LANVLVCRRFRILGMTRSKFSLCRPARPQKYQHFGFLASAGHRFAVVV
jgi:hypothetical protein